MMLKKLITFLIIFILILPSFTLNVFSESTSDEDESDNSLRILMFLLKMRFNAGFLTTLNLGRYFYRQFRPPVAIQAYPDAIDLRYLNLTKFEIGGKNPDTLEWEKMVKVAGGWDFAFFNPQVTYYFEFVPPEDSPEGAWNVQFDPPQLLMKTNKENLDWPGAEDDFRTNVSIQLKPSVDPNYPTQDVVLRFNIVREEALDHLRILTGSPKWARTQKQLYLEKSEEMDPDRTPFWKSPFSKFMWNRLSRRIFFFANLRYPAYDKWIDSTVEILVRVNKFHLADIVPPLPLDIEPYEVKSIPVTIINKGSHTDTFNFRVSSTDENMLVTPPPALTLKPGEEAHALVGVAAPKRFISIGSTSSIFLEAYSVDDPNSIFSNTIILSTVGINVSGGETYNIISLIIALIIIIAIILYILRRRREKIVKKPDKPWEIPEEKKYLERLGEKDKEKYNHALEMMKDEYRSALLWHRYYCDSLLRKGKKPDKKPEKKPEKKSDIIIKFKTGFKSLSDGIEKTLEKRRKARKEKIKAREKKLKAIAAKKKKIEAKKEEIKEKKPIEKPKEIEKVHPKKIEIKEKVVDRRAEYEKRRKNRTLDRIRREQERQVRKVGE
jgi:hypothetical protein